MITEANACRARANPADQRAEAAHPDGERRALVVLAVLARIHPAARRKPLANAVPDRRSSIGSSVSIIRTRSNL